MKMGQKIKDYLVTLAANDALPLDMNQLDASIFDKLFESNSKCIDLIGYTGIPIRACFIKSGTQRPNFPNVAPVQGSLVEFYDKRYPFTPDGQFIGEYYAETLLESSRDSGLNLNAGIPDWKIGVDAKKLVMDWVKEIGGVE